MAELENSVRLFARAQQRELIASCAPRRSTGGGPGGPGAAAGRAAGGRGGHRRRHEAPRHRAGEGHRHGPPGGLVARRCASASPSSPRSRWRPRSRSWPATSSSMPARAPSSCAHQGRPRPRPADRRHRTRGPGIEPRKLEEIWAGTYKSQRGMGKGLVAVKKLVDDFHLDTGPGRGTTVTCMFRGER